MDPIELRKRNAHTVGAVTATGQELTESVGLLSTIDQATEKANEVLGKKGVGTACMWYGVGNTGLPNPAGAFVEVLPDASVNLMVGCADIGQGSDTVMAQICAEELGVPYDSVNVFSADTTVTPEGGATSASRQTYISGNATKNAAAAAKKILAEVASKLLNTTEDGLTFANGVIWETANPDNKLDYKSLMGTMKQQGRIALGAGAFNPATTGLSLDTMRGSPYGAYAYATSVAEVEVDTETGRIYATKMVSAHDVGCPINHQMIEAQIEGGVAMGLGFALYEKIEVTSNGAISNPMFSKYILPTAMDVPEVYPIVVSSEGTSGPFGAKGVGEPALIAVIPAIAAAVENAIGIRFTKFPISPPDVLKAIEAQGK